MYGENRRDENERHDATTTSIARFNDRDERGSRAAEGRRGASLRRVEARCGPTLSKSRGTRSTWTSSSRRARKTRAACSCRSSRRPRRPARRQQRRRTSRPPKAAEIRPTRGRPASPSDRVDEPDTLIPYSGCWSGVSGPTAGRRRLRRRSTAFWSTRWCGGRCRERPSGRRTIPHDRQEPRRPGASAGRGWLRPVTQESAKNPQTPTVTSWTISRSSSAVNDRVRSSSRS